MLVNLMPYLLGDEDRLLTVFSFSSPSHSQSKRDDTILFEVELLHNTTVNNLLVCNLLLDGLTNEFASHYGDYFYGLDYKWINDGVKLMEAGSVPREMFSLLFLFSLRIFLLDGRLRSVDLYSQSDSSTKYQTNKQINPDWRNRRWTEQSDKAAKQPVVTVSTVSTVECRTTRGDRRSARRIC